ncbi:hypothetical protein HMPREF0539_1153 [Lacticaseibacillus rhamnosus LMS2-1]|uniref:Uncharacterized protein n=1 Tax=Lacticaseibacillus rhamnosus (strain LMS2-1) TaxID=525361 RepID=C2JW69_LACRM|nr:hypothetical protein HMPREF0539_1153 [Lacticaseibacillus rhamnosus LMS2-1]
MRIDVNKILPRKSGDEGGDGPKPTPPHIANFSESPQAAFPYAIIRRMNKNDSLADL